MALLTETGLRKLQIFSNALVALQNKLEHNEFQEPIIPIASDYSKKMLNDIIALSNELINNNNLRYWQQESKAQELISFFEHFDGKMNNFAPACFDIISYEIAKIYLDLLKNINIDQDLEWWTRQSLPLKRLLPFVIDNTSQLIKLFEFVANDKQSMIVKDSNDGQIYELIVSAKTLLLFIEGRLRREDEETKKAYACLFKAEHDSSVPDTLTLERIKSQYEAIINPLVQTFFASEISEISITGLNGNLYQIANKFKMVGAIIGTEPITIVDPTDNRTLLYPFTYLAITGGAKGFFLLNLLLNEKELIKGAQKQDKNFSLQGVIAHVFNTFDVHEYAKLLSNLYETMEKIKSNFVCYIRSSSSYSFFSKDAQKMELAENIVKAMNQILKEKFDNRPFFFTEYLSKLLSTMLQASLIHAHIVGTQSISHGTLGAIITSALNDVYQLVSTITVSTNPSIFYDFLSKEERESIPYLNCDVLANQTSTDIVIVPPGQNSRAIERSLI